MEKIKDDGVYVLFRDKYYHMGFMLKYGWDLEHYEKKGYKKIGEFKFLDRPINL